MFTWTLGIIFLFCLGMVLGSFFNVVIERMLAGEDFVRGFSRCDHCKHPLKWFDKIPLLSYLMLRGRCRYCHKKITVSHWFMELLFGALFAWWGVAIIFFLHLTQEPFVYLQPLFWLVVGLILVLILVIDYKKYIIPDELVVILTVLAFTYRITLVAFNIMQPMDLLTMTVAAFGASGFFLILYLSTILLTKKAGIGEGDIKLIFPLTLLVGWPAVIILIFTAFVIGAIVGIGLVVAGKKKMQHALPFGPFLILGTLLALLWGNEIVSWYLSQFG